MSENHVWLQQYRIKLIGFKKSTIICVYRLKKKETWTLIARKRRTRRKICFAVNRARIIEFDEVKGYIHTRKNKNERTMMSIDITSKWNNFYMIVKQNKAFFSYYFLYQQIEPDERNALVWFSCEKSLKISKKKSNWKSIKEKENKTPF